ncbi:hypothetical protein [Neolewinella litorea]|uniref:Uncharacterized protein n=1 Tax=Neolewinella litorea TaxID=2562452 RepID=A0A4S4NY78_9BACT|nr:hypothetical protein [Neolewinella litorea]THH41210.1 hypothetical protein E4021_01035 [Neolewinella litorea]
MLAEHPLPAKFSQTVPFHTELSLAAVIAKWRAEVPETDSDRQFIEEEIARCPEVLEPITDRNFFAGRQEFLSRLFSPLLPVKGWIKSAHSLCCPFDHDLFVYATDAYRRLYESDEVRVDSVDSLMNYTRIDARYSMLTRVS